MHRGRRRRPADKRRRASEVLREGGGELEPFLYVYELPPELNTDRQALPTYWHDKQYDCELPSVLHTRALEWRRLEAFLCATSVPASSAVRGPAVTRSTAALLPIMRVTCLTQRQ